jgi:phage N-6-adenine-methyltransferase
VSGFWTEAAFSSETDEHATPMEFWRSLDAEFHFTLDVCATKDNAKCDRFFTREDDGLSQEWSGVVWMNPPYGKHIGKWMEKARATSLKGWTVVCLVPARTDTNWWHDYATKASEIRFVRGRLTFGSAKAPAPFPSAVVIYRPVEFGGVKPPQ